MKLTLKNINGKDLGDVLVPKSFLESKTSGSVVRQAVLAEMVNLRQGTHSAKNRSSVRGGGKKPWKQKGRGAARAGTIRSPLWKGGGVVFGPNPHEYRHKVSKKMSLLARKSIFLDKIRKNEVMVFDNFFLETGKTSFFNKILVSLGLENKKITLLVSSVNENLDRSVNNLSGVYVVNVNCVSIYEMLDCDCILMDEVGYNNLIQMLMR
ncbi:MAG: 50S ribosomal protein L4 [Candidatus Marinimicrobia bacterium]|nr:50S ribosomal protein L4 [Candidatus Neomarinimicrobiota bacterium]|tara:strand:- start:3030 stop:3656 length:627 start_codon:yes stop_codon:yes gene_type:complete